MMILNFFLLSPNPNLGKDLKEIEIEYRLEFLTWIWYDVDLYRKKNNLKKWMLQVKLFLLTEVDSRFLLSPSN